MTAAMNEFLPGFAAPTADAQQTFRSILTAMSRPTIPQTLSVVEAGKLSAPAGLAPGVAAVVLTLADISTPLWVEPTLAADDEVCAWLRFHTGAPLVSDIGAADFVVASSPELGFELAELKQGSDEEPHLSATLILDTAAGDSANNAAGTSADTLTATGPGINGSAEWDAHGLPQGFIHQWEHLGTLFPRGIDVILVAGTQIRALPRTTTLTPREDA